MIYQIEKNPFIPLLEDYFKTEYNYTGSLDELHKILENLPTEKKQQCVKIFTIGKDDRQNIFIKNFHRFVDTSTMFETVYHAFVRKYIFPLFPEERQLVIQKTPNIRFSFPESAAIGKHEK